MSIEIDWDALTKGPEGAELAESIRLFIHEKFQEVHLPKFIRSVEVHTFEFGDACPSIVIKDICDPLPDFYEDEDEENGEDEAEEHFQHGQSVVAGPGNNKSQPLAAPQLSQQVTSPPIQDRRDQEQKLTLNTNNQHWYSHESNQPLVNALRQPLPRLQSSGSLAEQLASPILSRSSTPRIPGGTSSLSYFHLPLAGRIQGNGAQSPLSAVAGWQAHQAELHAQRVGGHAYSHQLAQHEEPSHQRMNPTPHSGYSDADPSTRPSTAHSHEHPHGGLHNLHEYPSPRTPSPPVDPDPNDLQIVLHISYSGNIRLSLTAEILLDYPMPSFVNIPLKLNITGLSFDGVALLALLQINGTKSETDENTDRRAHFCFLGQEDAETLVGAHNLLDLDEADRGNSTRQRPISDNQVDKLGSLLREMRVESEIGKTRDGRQNLKNVGKVEKFVLEQVRRIFEDEFVYPSFWTFLV